MPFSSVDNPVDLARAQAAMEAAWTEVVTTHGELLGDACTERARLAFVVASMIPLAKDDVDLVRMAVRRFVEQLRQHPPVP